MFKLFILLFAVLFPFSAIAQTEVSFSLPEFSFVSIPTENRDYIPPANAVKLPLNDHNDGSGRNEIKITKAGIYYLTGRLNGSLIVDVTGDEKVQLIFNGVQIASSGESALLILAADKNVTVSLAENSVNVLSSVLASDVANTDGAHDAAIYSKADLKFEDAGTLYISCTGGKGINCRDDLSVQDCCICILADDDGMRGKDSVVLSDAMVYIKSGADGIRSNNADKGSISVSGGQYIIDSALDAVQAEGTLTVTAANVTVRSGGGAKEMIKQQPDGKQPGGFGRPSRNDREAQKRMPMQTQSEDTESTKGLKSNTEVIISGGTVIVDAKDDAIHSNDNIRMNSGELLIRTEGDGLHADNALWIENGTVRIFQSHEGIEAADLNIAGGKIHITASDDGINAAGGQPEMQSGTVPRRGFGSMMSTTSGTLKISGGYTVVSAGGDGVDVNGSAEMTDGTLLIFGPSQGGNSSLDYDAVFTVSGGMLLAVGSAGMAQSVTAIEPAKVLAFQCSIPADTLLAIQEENGSSILTFKAPLPYSCVVFACNALRSGCNYQVFAEGEHSGTADDGIYYHGLYSPGTLLGTIPVR